MADVIPVLGNVLVAALTRAASKADDGVISTFVPSICQCKAEAIRCKR
jgi:hypothetical protein